MFLAKGICMSKMSSNMGLKTSLTLKTIELIVNPVWVLDLQIFTSIRAVITIIGLINEFKWYKYITLAFLP